MPQCFHFLYNIIHIAASANIRSKTRFCTGSFLYYQFISMPQCRKRNILFSFRKANHALIVFYSITIPVTSRSHAHIDTH